MGGLNKEIAQLELQISFYIDEINKLKKTNEALTEQLRIGGVVKSFYCQSEKFDNKECCKEQCITCFSKSV